MPTRIRLIGRYGNAVVTLLFGFLFLFGLVRGQFVIALLCAFVAGLAVFNVYVIEKAAAMTSEEEWLMAEIRKAELRRKLVSLNADTPETIGRQHGL